MESIRKVIALTAVPLLRHLLHHRQDILLRRPVRLIRDHRRLGEQEHALHVPAGSRSIRRSDLVVRGCQEIQGGMQAIPGRGSVEGVQAGRLDRGSRRG